MKKYFTVIVLSIFTFFSCEKDDICIEATTPSLVIRFYNNETQTELKEVLLDSVWEINLYSIEKYNNTEIDSLAIPLYLNQNETTYILENNSVKDTITFNYDRNDIFVSRSCGYKTIFENLQIGSNTTNWIKNISINNTIIENDTAAHISIFH
ncbi:DUF6452 family protein [Lutibacter sp.]